MRLHEEERERGRVDRWMGLLFYLLLEMLLLHPSWKTLTQSQLCLIKAEERWYEVIAPPLSPPQGLFITVMLSN